MPIVTNAVANPLGRGYQNTTEQPLLLDPSGALVVVDFLTKSLLDGRGFQIRFGVLTTPIETDILITTIAAEMSADSSTGHVLMPTHFTAIMETLSGGTLPDTRVMMTATASTAGDVFVPIPLKSGGIAAVTTARADAAGGVTVIADAVATTSLLYGSVLTAVGDFQIDIDLLGRGMVSGAGNIYVAQGSVTAGFDGFLALSYLEFTSGQLGL